MQAPEAIAVLCRPHCYFKFSYRGLFERFL